MESKIKNTEGAIMVEAILYFPLVIATVIFLIYIGLIKFQEAAFVYAIERTAQYAANEAAYPGYQVFSDKISTKTNFDWSAGVPIDDEENVRAYYEASHANLLCLYHEIFGSTWISEDKISSQFSEVANSASVLSIAKTAEYQVEKQRNIFGTNVVVGVSYQFKTPGIMRYLGLKDSYSYERVAYSAAINPAGFATNLNLAVDGLNFVLEKLGVAGTVTEYCGKITEFVDKWW